MRFERLFDYGEHPTENVLNRFLVAYDLVAPDGTTRDEGEYLTIESLLRAYVSQHVQKSVWLVETAGTAEALRGQIQEAMNAGDRLAILHVPPPPSREIFVNPIEAQPKRP